MSSMKPSRTPSEFTKKIFEAASGRQEPRNRFRPQAVSGMRLSERDETILCDLFLHRLMSRSQIEQSYFSSTVRCNARLRQLFDFHFVSRHYPPYAPYGAQALYSVGKAALPLVARRLDMELPEVTRLHRRHKTPTFIEHTLSIVDIWINLRKAVALREDMVVQLWLAEMQCRHEWEIRSEGSKWRKEVFKPDAFFRLERTGDGALRDFFIEADLGHTSAQQFTGKLLTHARYLESGLFDQTFGNESFHTLVVTTGERRLKNLKQLAALHNPSPFWFSTFERIAKDSLLAAVWNSPDTDDAMPLL